MNKLQLDQKMSVSYTWKVNNLKTADADGFTNVVVQVNWVKTGEDEFGNTGSFMGTTPFNTDGISSETFIAFESLTEELVLSWVQAIAVGDYAAHIDAHIGKQIESKKLKEVSLPWVSA
jgi:hypothetical protein